MSAAILEVHNLAAGYGKKQIVHGIDLAIDRGEILLVLGHNGAGKTTLMRAIFGLLKPTAGEVTYDGRPIAGRPPGDNVSEGIAFVPQGHGIFRTLSVRDNLELGGFIIPDKARLPARMQTVFELFPILGERQQQIGGTLSGGQQQMLAIGMALMHEPRVVILDEPSIGLAPNLVDRVMQSIAEINRSFGTSILMVEQNVRYSLPIATRVAVLKAGRKIYDGPPEHLQDDVELIKLF
jgi:branched-chain amino acid transport system ATP-binding protein